MANESDNEKLIVEIELDDGKLAKGFINAKSVATSEGKKAGESFGQNVEDGASKGLSALKGSLLGIGSALAAAFSVGAVVSAAQENEEAVNRLNGALRITGDFSPQASEGLQEYADQLSRLTTISGEAILDQLSFAKSLGATIDQSKQITAAAADMSAALGIGFDSAVSNLTRTLGGSAGALTKIIPELKNFTKEQLEAGAAIDLVAARFEGFSATKTMGFSGSLAGLKNSFGELVEEVGKLITKSPAVVATFNVMAKYLDQVTESVSRLVNDKEGMNGIADAAVQVGKAIVEYVIAPLELLYNISNVVFNLIKTGIQTLVTGMASYFGVLADLANRFGVDNDFTRGIQSFRDSTQEVLVDMAKETSEAGEKIFDFSVTDKVDTFVEEVKAGVEEIKNSTATIGAEISRNILPESLPYTFSNIFDGIKATLTKFEGTVQKFSAKIGATLMQGMGASAANAFAAFGAAVATGENALGAFIDSFLKSMGQMAIQLGSMFILEGAAMMLAGLANGGALMAAGAALAAFGGIMGALFGGQGKEGGGGIPVASPGTSPGNPVFTDSKSVNDAPEIQQERNPEVNIIVQGSIFDSGDTGRRLVDIINGAYDKEGVKIRRGAVA